jgi:hypothetical protein
VHGGLLCRGGSEGPCLGEVPRHKKKKKMISINVVLKKMGDGGETINITDTKSTNMKH